MEWSFLVARLRKTAQVLGPNKEENVKHGKLLLSLLLWMVAVVLLSAQIHAEPVLIKLTLETTSDYTKAISSGVNAYRRFEGFVIAEFERSKLNELDRAGLRYEIIDENPWTAEYFLVTSFEGMAKADLEIYGKILLKDPAWQLIKTSPREAAELRALRYSVVPIHHDAMPLKYEPPTILDKTVTEYSASIDSLLSLVSQDSLCIWDLRLQNFKTRYSYSDSIEKARDWVYNKFTSFGMDSVWLQDYYHDSNQWNVVATVPGTARPDRVVVVGAHYDSFVFYGPESDPFVWAPGADDNGSGTVATLEMARIIAAHPLPVTVMFVAFAQEEQGLIGSYQFAQYLFNQGTDVELMINSDMIGNSVDSDPDVEINAAQSDLRFADVMIAMANTYTYLRPLYGGQSFGSDHDSFYRWGYHAVSTFEGDYNTSVHTNYDVVHNLNFDYMKEVVKMCLATVIVAGNSPSAVESLKAVNGRDGHTAYLSWSGNHPSENVVHYKVYFGTTSGHYDSVHEVTATHDTLRGLVEDTTYFVAVTAINSDGLESLESQEVSFEAFPVTLDQGLLVVDETYDGSLTYNMVDGDSINAFYVRALQGYACTYVDHSCPNCSPQNQLRIRELVRYSPIIVYSEDNRGNRSLGASSDSSYLALKEYLNHGGKLIIEGRRNLSAGDDGQPELRQFFPGDVPYDYLRVESAYVPLWSPTSYRTEEFIGAFSQVAGYPDLQVDSLRVAHCSGELELEGKVPGVGYIDSLMAGEVIYTFHSDYDTSSCEAKPVAFRYLGDDWQVVYFDFPLYFIQESQATELLHKTLSDLGMPPTSVEDKEGEVVSSFSLQQNFPNPFNPETVIRYSLPRESQVRIDVYNILGQKVRTLVDRKEMAGPKSVTWDGENERGEQVSSGIYFYRLETEESAQTRKMLLLK